MNKIKVLFISLIVGVAFYSMVPKSHAVYGGLITGGDNAVRYTHVASSGVVINFACRFIGIALSSGAPGTFNYAVLYDTAPGRANLDISNFGDARRVTPALPFISTTTLSSPGGQTYTVYQPNGPYGVRVSSGIYYFPTSSSSGEAYRAIVIWNED